jgi:hypothetical protein
VNDKHFTEWTDQKLAEKERSYSIGDIYGDELRAEN